MGERRSQTRAISALRGSERCRRYVDERKHLHLGRCAVRPAYPTARVAAVDPRCRSDACPTQNELRIAEGLHCRRPRNEPAGSRERCRRALRVVSQAVRFERFSVSNDSRIKYVVAESRENRGQTLFSATQENLGLAPIFSRLRYYILGPDIGSILTI